MNIKHRDGSRTYSLSIRRTMICIQLKHNIFIWLFSGDIYYSDVIPNLNSRFIQIQIVVANKKLSQILSL